MEYNPFADFIPYTGLFYADYYYFCNKQTTAFEFADQHSTNDEPLSVFVYQTDKGYRKFAVAHPEVYWFYDQQRMSADRCSYEVIREGMPCKLYYDLEFPKELNPTRDGAKMTSLLIDLTRSYLEDNWELSCSKSNFLILDSSTPEKFSRHVILNISGMGFKDNRHVGRFVQKICNELVEFIENPSSTNSILSFYDKGDLEELFIQTDKAKKLFVDNAVYTKNRHFRIYKSTKWGKNAHLALAPECFNYIPRSDR